MNPGQLTIT